MRGGRGLTLIEVLASVVLLAVLAAACLPLFAAARRDLEEVQPPFEYGELCQFVDSLVAQGASGSLGHAWFAMADPTEIKADPRAGDVQTEIPWPADTVDRPPVRVRILRAEQDARHAWVVFSAGPWTVCRWVEVVGEVDANEDGSAP